MGNEFNKWYRKNKMGANKTATKWLYISIGCIVLSFVSMFCVAIPNNVIQTIMSWLMIFSFEAFFAFMIIYLVVKSKIQKAHIKSEDKELDKIPVCLLYNDINSPSSHVGSHDHDYTQLYFDKEKEQYVVIRDAAAYNCGGHWEYPLDKDYFEKHTVDDFVVFLKNIENNISKDKIAQNTTIMNLFSQKNFRTDNESNKNSSLAKI